MEVKNDIEKEAEKIGAICDHIVTPSYIYKFGWKCLKGRV